jgi:hypothetical protein
MTSAFLLTLQFEWALIIFLTVPRGYIFFCPRAMFMNVKPVWILEAFERVIRAVAEVLME